MSESSKTSWYPLDHSAKIWPALQSKRYTSFFRLSVVLEKPVVIDDLMAAVANIRHRMPYFSVKLRRGLFWYVLEQDDEDIPVLADHMHPCMDYDYLTDKRRLISIRVYSRRISLEISHILSDGTGALQLLRALVFEYLEIRKGKPERSEALIEGRDQVPFLASNTPGNDEWVDSYLGHGLKGAPIHAIPEKAFHLPFSLLPTGEYRIITGHIPLSEVLTAAKRYQCSLTEYLCGLLFLSFQDYWKKLHLANRRVPRRFDRPIRILVPVNLRPMFESKTMRNFFVYVDPEIDPRLGEFSKEEIMQYVHYYMRGQKNRQNMKRHFARHARTERSMSVRLVPLWLKNLFLGITVKNRGDTRITTSMSNLGAFQLPDEHMKEISWVDFYPPPSPIMKQAVSIISAGDVLSVNFGKLISESVIEQRFFRLLREDGCHPVISGYGALRSQKNKRGRIR